MKEQYGKWTRDKSHGSLVRNLDDPEIVGFIKFQKSASDHKEKQFLNEVNSLKGLDHPNVVKLLDYDLESERPYMVTEYCSGGDLKKVDLSEWTVNEKFQCYQQVCNAFAYLFEQGITKSDHNPKNIFLKENKIPVIGDFESARPITKDAEGVRAVLGQASRFLWELMEGKEFNLLLSNERRINQQIEAHYKQIEELKAQKAELYNTPPL